MARLHEIADEKFMAMLFHNLARDRSIPATVHIDGRRFPSEIFFDRRRGYEPGLRISPETRPAVNGDPVRIAFLHKGMFFLYETRLQPSADGTYAMEKTPLIYSSFRRLLPRYRFEAGEGGWVRFPDCPGEYPLVDISTEGLSFLSDRRLWGKGEMVRNVTLSLDSGIEVCIDARVTYCIQDRGGNHLHGLRVSESGWFPRQELFKYIARKTYPNIRWMEEFSTAQIHDLYGEAGYLSLKAREEMEHSFARMVATYAKIRGKRQVSVSPVYVSDGRMLTVGSVLRIYDRTFLGHQLASLPEARLNMKAKRDVYFVLADFLIDHLHCENYLSYFDINLSWHQEVFKRIGGCIDDSQKFIFDELEFFECRAGGIEAGDERDGHKVEVLDNPERFLRFCDRWLKPLEVRCYAYDAAHFNLREITQVYDVLDLYLARRLWSVVRKGKVVAYAVAEAYSEGLNLFNLLDMCRVYFTEDHTDKQRTLKALIPQVELFFRKFKKENFYVAFSLPHGDPQDLVWRGFEHRHSAGRVMMSRQGMVEYRTVLAMNSRQ